MDFISAKLWLLVIGVVVVFVAAFVYRLVTGRSLEEAVQSDRQEPRLD